MKYKDLANRKPAYYAGLAKDEFCPRKDLRGQKFGRLTVIDFDRKGGKNGRTYYYKCLCDCNNTCVKSASYLLRKDKYAPHKSCGCWHRELYLTSSTKHGHGTKGKSSTYKIWCEIKIRCCNPNNHAYHNYGGRGIRVCDRWLHSFENFLADMGERPSTDHSIDRIDVNGNYCPENCRWATRKEQANNRRSNILVEYNGKTQTLKQWCDELGLNFSNARYVLRKTGRSFEYIVNHQLNKR